MTDLLDLRDRLALPVFPDSPSSQVLKRAAAEASACRVLLDPQVLLDQLGLEGRLGSEFRVYPAPSPASPRRTFVGSLRIRALK